MVDGFGKEVRRVKGGVWYKRLSEFDHGAGGILIVDFVLPAEKRCEQASERRKRELTTGRRGSGVREPTAEGLAGV